MALKGRFSQQSSGRLGRSLINSSNRDRRRQSRGMPIRVGEKTTEMSVGHDSGGARLFVSTVGKIFSTQLEAVGTKRDESIVTRFKELFTDELTINGDLNIYDGGIRISAFDSVSAIQTTNDGDLLIRCVGSSPDILFGGIVADVKIPVGGKEIQFSGANGTLTTDGTYDLTLNTNEGTNSGSIVIYDGASGNIDITSKADITLDADGGNIYFKDNGTTYIDFQVDGTHDKMVVTGSLTIDASVDITLDADGGEIFILDGGTKFGEFSTALSKSILKLYDQNDNDDYFIISVSANGATVIAAVDADADNADLKLTADGDLTFNSVNGVFIAEKNGSEFSAVNSAYAGMILGYTRIANDGTSATDNVITLNSSSMTVIQTDDGTDLSIQFIVPPSGNVEIQCSFYMNGTSKGARFSLSKGASYDELGITHTYDAAYTIFIDETDRNVSNISFAVTGLVAGQDKTYYLAALAGAASTFINHGRHRTTGNHYPPIILRAIALPATIVTGE